MRDVRLCLFVGLFFAANAAWAQPDPLANHNYYTAVSDSDPQHALLRTVEQYHLKAPIDAVRRHKANVYVFSDLDFILKAFPNHPRALLLMSDVCQLWQDRRCDAERYIDKGITLTPNIAELHVIKGLYLQKRNRLAEAVSSYERALEISPDSLNAHYNIGLAYVAQNDYLRANEHAQRAYALNPSLPQGLRNMLVKARAWKPLESPSAPAPTQSELRNPDGPAPLEAPSKPN